MKLDRLLNNVKDFKIIGKKHIDIKNLSQNSKKISKNALFFCINGTKTDGSLYIFEAINNGAVAFVLNKNSFEKFKNIAKKRTNFFKKLAFVIVNDVRKSMAVMASNFYNNPEKKLRVVGITGTNGKTSCSYIISNLLKKNGKRVGVIGTNGIFILNKRYEEKLTTPDSIELFEIFSKMVKQKVEFCIMEVSAHAIYFDKIFEINFDIKVLTNIKTDHLDFFKTKNNYVKTKEKFFLDNSKKVIVIDDKYSKHIAENCNNCVKISANKKNKFVADFFLEDVKCCFDKTEFRLRYLNNINNLKTNLLGKFNAKNIVIAIAVLILLGFEKEKIFDKILSIKKLDGRFNIVFQNGSLSIIIDYAHTIDSLKSFLCEIKRVSKNFNIIVLGCPGERDTTKRFLSGVVACKFCDVVILTSDNPASENPKRIMFEMEQGLKSQNKKICYFLIENREKAIKKAINLAKKQKKCNILIVGKGIERYQIVGDKKLQYCDYDVVNKYVKDL